MKRIERTSERLPRLEKLLALTCKMPDELLTLAKEEGYELADEEWLADWNLSPGRVQAIIAPSSEAACLTAERAC